MNIQDKLSEIEDKFAGTYKKELLDIWAAMDDLQKDGRKRDEKYGHFAQSLANKASEIIDIWHYLHSQERPEPILQVKLLHENAKVPTRGSGGAIGWDLYAAVHAYASLPVLEYIRPHSTVKVPTGISIAIPHGYYGRVAPRSGLAAKQGVDILAGVIDSDYRGEVMVLLHNTTDRDILVDVGKPIAQLILERADVGKLMVVDELSSTARGAGGFGSTDKVKESSNDPSHT